MCIFMVAGRRHARLFPFWKNLPLPLPLDETNLPASSDLPHAAPALPSLAMDDWAKFFESAGVDLWTVCERALAIAYQDDPQEFVARRDGLAQKLFAPEKLDLRACEPVTVPQVTDSVGSGGMHQVSALFCDGGIQEERRKQQGLQLACSGSFDEAEALTQELEQEMLFKQDVLAIKEALQDHSYQPEREIYDSLQRLELMRLSFDLLKDTEIGKVVNGLRKNPSTRVATLAKRLIREWKELVQVCCTSAVDVAAAASAELADGTASGSTVFDEEPGLPSPPMDEAALLVASTASVDVFQLWDFMDDVTSTGSGYPTVLDNKPWNSRAEEGPDLHGSINGTEHVDSKMIGTLNMKELNVTSRTNKPDEKSGLQRGYREPLEARPSYHSLHRKVQAGAQQKNHTVKPSGTSVSSDEKMEAAKRNLRVNYEREENAKKQRTIQVLDLHDLPKHGPARAKAPHLMHGRPSSHPRPRALSCR